MDPKYLDHMWRIIQGSRKLNWSVVQRGFWTNGASDFRAFLEEVEQFTLDGWVGQIRYPTLLTVAENDLLAKNTEKLNTFFVQFKVSALS